MSTISVPAAMPVIEKLSVNLTARLPMPAMIPAPSGTRLTGLAKSTRFSIQILAPEQADHPVEHERDPAEHAAGRGRDDRAELRAEAEQDRDDRGDVVGQRRVDPGRGHDADVLGVGRRGRTADEAGHARCPRRRR